MTAVTAELIFDAYVALVSGDRRQAVKYWAEDLRFLVPGRHAQAGWREGLDDLLAFRRALDEASGGSFTADPVTSMINDDHSMDVVRVHAVRAGAPAGSTSPYDVLDGRSMQVFRWSEGRVVEGYAGWFGDGAINYEQWWSPIGPDGTRRDI
ncbi:nuclear transport factor 2 family protein [Streptomyces polygonati]|uniref:Nuclear transport factor 2 family protein n=1 Tax=Streptomyces polygonati TaxID=1617087 RepID=A0ABV8HTI9_9ACTN